MSSVSLDSPIAFRFLNVEQLRARDLFTIVLSPFGIHLVNLYGFLHHYFSSSVSYRRAYSIIFRFHLVTSDNGFRIFTFNDQLL